MATFGEVYGIPMVARSDLRAKQYHIARYVSRNVCDLASASNVDQSDVFGIIQTKANSGRVCNIGVDGESQVVAGAAFSAGAILTTNSSGRAITAVSGDWMLGTAQEAAGADGELIRCLMRQPSLR